MTLIIFSRVRGFCIPNIIIWEPKICTPKFSNFFWVVANTFVPVQSMPQCMMDLKLENSWRLRGQAIKKISYIKKTAYIKKCIHFITYFHNKHLNGCVKINLHIYNGIVIVLAVLTSILPCFRYRTPRFVQATTFYQQKNTKRDH